MHKANKITMRDIFMIVLLFMINLSSIGQNNTIADTNIRYVPIVDTAIVKDSWDIYQDSRIILDQNQNKERIKEVQNQINGTWKYEGQFLNNEYINDTTEHIIAPYESAELQTKTGVYVIRFSNQDTSISKQNIYKTLTFGKFYESIVNAKFPDECTVYAFDYFIDKHEFEDVTCQPTCSIGYYKGILGLKYEGHFEGEWFIPILELSKDKLVLKEKNYRKVYSRFKEQLKE